MSLGLKPILTVDDLLTKSSLWAYQLESQTLGLVVASWEIPQRRPMLFRVLTPARKHAVNIVRYKYEVLNKYLDYFASFTKCHFQAKAVNCGKKQKYQQKSRTTKSKTTNLDTGRYWKTNNDSISSLNM